jgi:hypothetical protein
VLVIASTNLAGLLLSRAYARRREIAMRVALGAGRDRLIRQLLTETLLLFVMGGAAGAFLAHSLTSWIAWHMPALPVPLDVSLSPDGRVMAFTMGLSLIAGIACGLVPALQAANPDVIGVLKHDDPVSVSGRGQWRSALVVAQVAFSVVLIAGASVFVRALQKATSIERGFGLANVEVAAIDLGLADYTPEKASRLIRDLVQRVRALPGVEQATVAASLPTGDGIRFGPLTHPGTVPDDGAGVFHASSNAVEPGYFATLGIPLRAGRDFDRGDVPGAPAVAIVSEEAARRFWPGVFTSVKVLARKLCVTSASTSATRNPSSGVIQIHPNGSAIAVPIQLVGSTGGDRPGIRP